jgi:hypothetical protein
VATCGEAAARAVAMRGQTGTGTDPDALEGAAPLIQGISPLAARRSCARSAAGAGRFAGVQPGAPRILTACVRLHHIVADAHDLPGLARFRTQASGRKVLSERESEIVIGTDGHTPAGMCSGRSLIPRRSSTVCTWT